MPQDARDLKGKTGIRRLINATRYSRDGFAKAFRTEEAFRQESILSVVGLVALFSSRQPSRSSSLPSSRSCFCS